MKTFKKENCQKYVRNYFKTTTKSFLLIGRYAHEYSIVEQNNTNNRVEVTEYKNGDEARKQFRMLKKFYRPAIIIEW